MTDFARWARPLIPTVVCLIIAIAFYLRRAALVWDALVYNRAPSRTDVALPFFYVAQAIVWVLIALVLRFL